MATSYKQMLEAAHATVPKITAADAARLQAQGALIVDVRDGTEVAATGKAKGAVAVPRGSLESRADAETAERARVHPVARLSRPHRLGGNGHDIAAVADIDGVVGQELVELPRHAIGMDRPAV